MSNELRTDTVLLFRIFYLELSPTVLKVLADQMLLVFR